MKVKKRIIEEKNNDEIGKKRFCSNIELESEIGLIPINSKKINDVVKTNIRYLILTLFTSKYAITPKKMASNRIKTERLTSSPQFNPSLRPNLINVIKIIIVNPIKNKLASLL